MTTNNLFKHVACYTDIHYGLRNNNRQHNQDCLDFTEWFVKQAKERNAETCIFLGDYHHHRSSINVSTLNYVHKGIKLMADNFEKVYIIAGNHDLFYRDRRDLNSFPFAEDFPNITVVCDDIFTEDNVTIVPWLVGDEWRKMSKLKSRYVFGHFELPDFYMNTIVKMPNHRTLQLNHFDEGPEYVFSGHFHKRQNINNIYYIGNPFGHTYADVGDTNRGAMFLEWDGEPQFVNYDGPKYQKVMFSDLITSPEKYLDSKTFCQVIIDIHPVSYEELEFVKKTYTMQYSPRELKLISLKQNMADDTITEFKGDFKTVNEIIHEQIQAIDSTWVDKQMLLELYKNL